SGELTRCDFPVGFMDRDGNQTGFLFKSHREGGFDLAKLADAGEHECGPYIRMAGKRNLSGRRKDSDVPRVAGLRRKNQRGLGEIELTRDLLHLLRREPISVRQYGQLISTEARVGEHITRVIAVLHPDDKR